MKIKICCEAIEGYINSLYIKLNEYDNETKYNKKNEVVIDTALYEENQVEIEYCPFCGKKIEIIEGEMP